MSLFDCNRFFQVGGEKQRDQKIMDAIIHRQGFSFEDLDLSSHYREQKDLWGKFKMLLQGVNTSWSPRKKLCNILQASKLLYEIIQAIHANNSRGADEFLPLVIAGIALTKPLDLLSNLK